MIGINGYAELKNDRFYFECCAGLGDTLLTCGYLHALKEKYQAPIQLIVKPSHTFIPEMYGIKNSLVIGSDITAKYIEKNTETVPQKGKVYAAHPCKHPEMWAFFEPIFYWTSTIRFMTWFKKFFKIDENTEFEAPLSYPKLSEKLVSQCDKLAPLEKIVLISPEATSVSHLPASFWKKISDRLQDKGFTVLSNVINPLNVISGTKYINMSSSEAVALSMMCHSVYSVRSGLCDLIYRKGANLHVFYPHHNLFYIYEMNCMFPGNGIDEQIILSE